MVELLVGVTDVIEHRHGPTKAPRSATGSRRWLGVPNDLEPPALRVQPVIAAVLSALRGGQGVQLARMSGSGATCFAIFSSASDAQARPR